MSNKSIVSFALFLAIVLWDLYLVTTTGSASTVSQWIADATGISPIQAYGAGVLTAHFFGWMMVPRQLLCAKCKAELKETK